MGLGPLTAAGLGWLLLGEPVSVLFFAGLIGVVAGLYLALARVGDAPGGEQAA